MNAKKKGTNEQSPISRREFIRGPLLYGGGALVLTQLGCDIVDPAELGDATSAPLTAANGIWEVGEITFSGNVTEMDRDGQSEIRCIDPRILSHDEFGFEIERYDGTAPMTRSNVFVRLDDVEEAYLFASRGTLTYEHWMPNTDLPEFAERLRGVYAGVGLITGHRALLIPIPRADLEVTHVQLLADDEDGRSRRVFAKSPVVGLGRGGSHLVVSGKRLEGTPSVAEGAFRLDGVRLVEIEARDARSPESLIKITASASGSGRLGRVAQDMLRTVYLL